jgi:hypothetical protein
VVSVGLESRDIAVGAEALETITWAIGIDYMPQVQPLTPAARPNRNEKCSYERNAGGASAWGISRALPLHGGAAYGGAALSVTELRERLRGIEHADSPAVDLQA